jgi:outer membrane protein OmpA-like peptidoglycan-associated protein
MSLASLRWLSLALAAAAVSQAQEPQPRFGKWPIELQGQVTQTGYAPYDATAAGTLRIGVGAPLSLGLRASLEPFCLPTGRLQLSLAYGFGAKVDVDRHPFDLRDEGGMALGALYLYDLPGRWALGAGLDLRHDNLRATGFGSPTYDNAWRPWARGVLRHDFPGTGTRRWFVALEGALALGKADITHQTYYWDYSNLTGTAPLGPLSAQPATQSLVRGHMPTGSLSLALGLRWGSSARPCGDVTPPRAAPPTPVLATPAPVVAPEPRAVAAPPPPAPRSEPGPAVPEPVPAEAAGRVAAAAVSQKAPEVREVEGLVVRFALNRHDSGRKALAIVREWARANKGLVDPGAITVTGHCDESGGRAHNERLSLNRAKAVAEVLRKEGLAVAEGQVSGKCWDVPEVPNASPENRARNRRGVIGIREGAPFKIVRPRETPVIVSLRRAPKAEAAGK